MKRKTDLVVVDTIAGGIFVLRGLRVMLDSDLAVLYGVSTKRLNEQVRRNPKRFPADFKFEMDDQEVAILKSQIATSSPGTGRSGWGGRRTLPYAFTEHGAIMVANVLASSRAIEMSVHVVRAFVRLREMAGSNKDMAKRLDELEARLGHKLSTHDQAIAGILEAIRGLMNPPATPKRRRIGFLQDE